MEDFGRLLFAVMRAPGGGKKGESGWAPVYAFVGERFMVAYSPLDGKFLDSLREFVRAFPERLREPLRLLHKLALEVARRFHPLVERLEAEADRLAEETMENPHKGLNKAISRLRRAAFRLRGADSIPKGDVGRVGHGRDALRPGGDEALLA